MKFDLVQIGHAGLQSTLLQPIPVSGYKLAISFYKHLKNAKLLSVIDRLFTRSHPKFDIDQSYL